MKLKSIIPKLFRKKKSKRGEKKEPSLSKNDLEVIKSKIESLDEKNETKALQKQSQPEIFEKEEAATKSVEESDENTEKAKKHTSLEKNESAPETLNIESGGPKIEEDTGNAVTQDAETHESEPVSESIPAE